MSHSSNSSSSSTTWDMWCALGQPQGRTGPTALPRISQIQLARSTALRRTVTSEPARPYHQTNSSYSVSLKRRPQRQICGSLQCSLVYVQFTFAANLFISSNWADRPIALTSSRAHSKCPIVITVCSKRWWTLQFDIFHFKHKPIYIHYLNPVCYW